MRAQFFVNIHLDVAVPTHIDLIPVLDCELRASAIFDMVLDSRGALVFTLNDMRIDAVGGSGCEDLNVIIPPAIVVSQPGAKSIIQGAIENNVRFKINKSVIEMQSIPPNVSFKGVSIRNVFNQKFKSFTRPEGKLFPTTRGCDPSTCPARDANLAYAGLGPDICFDARGDFCALVRAGYTGRTPTFDWRGYLDGPTCEPSPDDDRALLTMFETINERDADGNLKHWVCEGMSTLNDNNEPTNPTTGQCLFVVPAQRVIPNPDGLQLYFHDNADDFENAAVVAGYAVAGAGRVLGLPLTKESLCSYRRPEASQHIWHVDTSWPKMFVRPFELFVMDNVLPCSSK